MTSWELTTPDAWDRIPTDPDVAPTVVRRIAARQFQGRDDLPHLRVQLEDVLTRLAADARESGGIELYLSNLLVADLPLPTSLVVSLAPWVAEATDEDALEVLERELVAADGVGVRVESTSVSTLPAGPALRRETTVVRSGMGPDSGVADSFSVQWWVPVPSGEPALVLLSFSSPLVPLREGLARLFDAIAATLRFGPTAA